MTAICVHTDSTDQYEFDSVGDALNYIEEMIEKMSDETMSDETMTVYVKERDA